MDDPTFKNNYEKYKLRVKKWEKDFIKKYKRIPSKYDIKEAPNDIRYSYKMYYKLKTAFLENALSDVLSDDGFEFGETENCNSQSADNSGYDFSKIYLPSGVSFLNESDETTKTSSVVLDTSNTNITFQSENTTTNELKEFEPVDELDINKKAWIGVSRSKSSNEVQKIEKEEEPPLVRVKSALNTKLFEISKSFSKRNPRKSLSRSSFSNLSSQSNLSLHEQNDKNKLRESLPDLETILTQKAKEQKSPILNSATNLFIKKSKDLSINVDAAWLDRVANGSDDNAKDYKISPALTSNSEKNKKFGISNIYIQETSQNKEVPLANGTENKEISSKNEVRNIILENKALKNIYQYESNSDEVVSNSEDENKESYRQIAKRRRILRDVDRNKLNVQSQNPKEILKTYRGPKETTKIVTVSGPVQEKSENVELKNLLNLEKNNVKPKKITSKSKKKNSTASTISEKHTDESCEECYDPDFKGKEKKPKRKIVLKAKPTDRSLVAKKTRNPRKNKRNNLNLDIETDLPPLEENKEEEYSASLNLVLEADHIKSLPSANFEELKKVEKVLDAFISDKPFATQRTLSSTLKFTPGAKLDIRKSESQAKLEEKMRKGKLNENFVRIDINKKVFVRGKKSVNYSRYKKKQWKFKKQVYSLTGSDMDMRGCDGGILTCHKCGQPGHFERQCKQKGDSLLPLTAEQLDESPYLTLEEAAKMAQDKAVSVHSRNISKLPDATNLNVSKSEIAEEKNQDNDSDMDAEIVGASDDSVDDNDKIDEIENVEKIDKYFDDDFLKTEIDIDNCNIEKESKESYIGHKIPKDFLEKCGLFEKKTDKDIIPIYDLNADGTIKSITEEVMEALRMFGHKTFRKGQDKAVMRVLSGFSTLVTLSTGSGKSLCYQLPAYLYSRKKGYITLVISPLVSLMEDQVTDVPLFLRAYCLHTNQTARQRLKIMELINKGDIDILLVSPEAVVAGERSTGFGALLGNLPPIAFACIDEAHCVSQWSHNFRPSYLMICKVLQQKLGVKTILGLTATATLPTRQSIIRHLNITDGEDGIIKDIPLPDNLVLSISKESNRDNALMQILRSERFESCQSIIIYCTRREECERISGFIRTCMQDKPTKINSKRKRVNWHAESYHAGLPASRRRTIQNAFMSNELRIVVATIAFGMGINKPDIRAVIHYNMPKSYESYVQEIGRAGRDGKLAHCHLFLDSRGQDHSELKKHIFGNSIDRHVIRKLLQKVFIPCSCNKNMKSRDFVKTHKEEIEASQHINWDDQFEEVEDSSCLPNKPTEQLSKRLCPGHEIGFSIEETVQALDIPAENISTLLCYLELDGQMNLNILSNSYTKCKILSYGGSKYLKNAAKNCPPLAMAIALKLKSGTFDKELNVLEFSVIEIASSIGWNSGVVKHQLKQLEWVKVDDVPKRSSISVTFYDLGFRVKAPGDFKNEEMDRVLDFLYQRSVKQEKTQLLQLQYISDGLGSVAFKSCFPCCDKNFDIEISNKLKTIIRSYFQHNSSTTMEFKEESDNTPDTVIVNDIQSMINMYPDNNFTGRSLARIFYGIGSPNFPPVIWSRCKYWRSHMKVDFNRLVKLANDVIVRLRM